jgi:hypothetical protein
MKWRIGPIRLYRDLNFSHKFVAQVGVSGCAGMRGRGMGERDIGGGVERCGVAAGGEQRYVGAGLLGRGYTDLRSGTCG